MAFTVSLPGVTRNFEFEAYVRLLEKNGVNVARAPRVQDPVSGKRWLYAWDAQADADAFAAALREDTENERWKVYALPDAVTAPGPLGPIDILVSRRSDGCTYSLSPTSRKLVLKTFPHTRLVPSVFISTVTESDCEQTHGPIWDQVAMILTGLPEQQIQALSGYRVIDPVARTTLKDVPPLVA